MTDTTKRYKIIERSKYQGDNVHGVYYSRTEAENDLAHFEDRYCIECEIIEEEEKVEIGDVVLINYNDNDVFVQVSWVGDLSHAENQFEFDNGFAWDFVRNIKEIFKPTKPKTS